MKENIFIVLCIVALIFFTWLSYLETRHQAQKDVFESCLKIGSFTMPSTGWEMDCDPDTESMMSPLEDMKNEIER